MSDEQEGLPERLDPEEARAAVAGRGATVVDIRDEDAFATERIFGSVRVDEDEIDDALGEEDEDATLLIVCADGERSAAVAERLRSDGRKAASIEGGFDAWASDGLPTAPGRDEEYEGPDVKIPGAVASDGEPDEDEEDESEEEAATSREDG